MDAITTDVAGLRFRVNTLLAIGCNRGGLFRVRKINRVSYPPVYMHMRKLMIQGIHP